MPWYAWVGLVATLWLVWLTLITIKIWQVIKILHPEISIWLAERKRMP